VSDSRCGVAVRVNESSSGRKYESRHICIKIYIVEMRESDCDKKGTSISQTTT
jgi:hypothetical protein